jgi:hypothetical protein
MIDRAVTMAKARGMKGYSTPCGEHDRYSAHYAGVVGELAFAALVGGVVNNNVGAGEAHTMPDVIAGAFRYEIKTVCRGEVALIFSEDPEPDRNDCYVLCVYHGGATVQFMGCALPEDIMDRTKLAMRNYGYGDRWVLSPQYLRPIEVAITLAGAEGYRNESDLDFSA